MPGVYIFRSKHAAWFKLGHTGRPTPYGRISPAPAREWLDVTTVDWDEEELRRVDWDVEELGALIESARIASCALEARERCERAERTLLLLKQRQRFVM
jgi:hypothetical protein